MHDNVYAPVVRRGAGKIRRREDREREKRCRESPAAVQRHERAEGERRRKRSDADVRWQRAVGGSRQAAEAAVIRAWSVAGAVGVVARLFAASPGQRVWGAERQAATRRLARAEAAQLEFVLRRNRRARRRGELALRARVGRVRRFVEVQPSLRSVRERWARGRAAAVRIVENRSDETESHEHKQTNEQHPA